MIMKRSFVSLAAAGALALAVTAAPKPAHAVWWIAPAIAAGVVGGVAVGAAADNAAYANNGFYGPGYNPPGNVYVQPTAGCHWTRVQTASGALVRERVCP